MTPSLCLGLMLGVALTMLGQTLLMLWERTHPRYVGKYPISLNRRKVEAYVQWRRTQ